MQQHLVVDGSLSWPGKVETSTSQITVQNYDIQVMALAWQWQHIDLN